MSRAHTKRSKMITTPKCIAPRFRERCSPISEDIPRIYSACLACTSGVAHKSQQRAPHTSEIHIRSQQRARLLSLSAQATTQIKPTPTHTLMCHCTLHSAPVPTLAPCVHNRRPLIARASRASCFPSRKGPRRIHRQRRRRCRSRRRAAHKAHLRGHLRVAQPARCRQVAAAHPLLTARARAHKS